LGFPIGNALANITKEEIKPGRKWFKILIVLSLIGAIIFLILGRDDLLFAFLFIAIITSRSLKR
jgi:biotin transporter BioY